MDTRMERINNAASYLEGILKEHGLKPQIGIILGSGLGKLADRIENPVTVPYRDIPGFPVSTAIGHKGNFIIGTLADGDSDAGAHPLLRRLSYGACDPPY